MRWIKLRDGRRYTLAVDIQKLAEQNGYNVPCEADGTRHPGTDCNAKMRTIMKDAGLRHTFGITDGSVVDIRIDHTYKGNLEFIQWMVDSGIISDTYFKIGVIQLYTEQAVNALLSMMLKTQVSYTPTDDKVYEYSAYVAMKVHNFEKKQNKPKVSLFRK